MKITEQDIDTIDDIKLMVDRFYKSVIDDAELNSILKKLSRKKWKIDILKIYDFWNKLLFAKGDYDENPFANRIPILIEEKHYDKWLFLFNQIVDEYFKGTYADTAKGRAAAIVFLYQNKLKYEKPKRKRRTKEEMKKESFDDVKQKK